MATNKAVPCPAPIRKVARLNPARRKKAAKAKENGHGLQSVEDASSTNQVVGLRPQTAKSSTPRAIVLQPALSRHGSIQKTAACNEQAQSVPVVRARLNGIKQYSAVTNTLSTPAAVTGGLIGCVAGAIILLGAGLCSRIAGVDSALITARTSKAVVNNLTEETIISLKSGTYNPPEAVDMLRRTSLAYANSLPGGTAFVEHLFREIDLVRRQRGEELDQTLTDACYEIANVRKSGANASEMHTTVLKQLSRLSALTGHAAQDVVARNPGLRPYLSAAGKQKVPTVKLNMIVQKKSAGNTCRDSRTR